MLIRFANAALLDPREGALREPMHVLVDGERIAEVSDRPIAGRAGLARPKGENC